MQHQLVISAGPDQGRSLDLADAQPLVIGRGQQSDTQINDPHMSRVHCEVRLDGGSVVVRDCGSSSGTLIGDDKIDERTLRPGESFVAGSCTFQYRVQTADDETTVVGAAPSRPAPSQAKPLPELVGETLGSFKLTRIVTKGHSGMVFEAEDTEKSLKAAVKVLSPEIAADDQQKQRFVRAMKTMIDVRHENLVALYAAGKQGPYCWAAMEYVDGKSMADVIDDIGAAGMLEWQDAFRVAVHVGRALEAAHERTIVHRNVTPQNILQRKSDQVVKLGDLMLAKALEGTLAQQVTQPGQIVGDIPYLAPERTVDAAKADIRADIYGLGATLYALLTGRPPFESDYLPDLLAKIRTEEAEPPKKYHLAIPDLFQDAVMKMLAKRPDDRYKTPSELLKDLDRVGRYQGVEV